LQPSTKESGELKYDMRIIAQNVEYYILMRDQQNFNVLSHSSQSVERSMEEMGISRYHQNDLQDSLWYFDGVDIRVWTDTQELLASTPPDLGRELPEPVAVPVDFYPLSVLLSKGILFGIEPDFTQRRDSGFTILRFVTRVSIQY
jgi:RAB6A-GEF complex partner protein 1